MGLGAAAAPLFPPVEPRRSGYLPVGDGHRLYFEECGPADGLPVVFLHGGPGSGCTPAQRRLFDPYRYRAILVDQRGCGRSQPLGALAANTTAHLVADLETLRQALAIPAWIVFGGSWGSTLALAYAQAHPARVAGLVLRGIFLGSREEIAAYCRELGVPDSEAGGTDVAAWAYSILHGAAPAAERSARAWLDYERARMGEPPLAALPDAGQMAKARLQMHYLAQDCFLASGKLLAGVEALRGIPAALVQGLVDPVCPPAVARRLHQIWPEAAWLPVAAGGHGGLSPPIASACMAALDAIADHFPVRNGRGIPTGYPGRAAALVAAGDAGPP